MRYLDRSSQKTISIIKADLKANPKDPKICLTLVLLRITQMVMGGGARPRTISFPFIILYRLWTEIFVGFELRPKTQVGAGLTIFHGFGMVVNDHAVIGQNVVLRNGVVVGSRVDGGPCPTIENGVKIGAGAIILGGITVGAGARIGAGAVVLKDVPPGRTAVGNPARLL